MSTTACDQERRPGAPEGAPSPERDPGASAGPGVAAKPREVMDPVTQLALLASAEPGAGAELEALQGMPGLAARLASISEEIWLIARSYPTWCMPEAGVGDAIEQAQRVRDAAHTLTAVLAGEVTSRGLGMREGLSRNDWIAAHAPVLDGAGAAELTAVGAVLAEPRWRPLARMLRSGATTVDRAAVIVRFHQDAVTYAEREHLEGVVDSMVEQAGVLGAKELRRVVARARVSLRPAEQVEADDARMRAGRSLSRVGRSAGLVEYRLRLDPEGAAVLDAAIDPLARPRPDLDWAERAAPYRHPVCGHLIPEPGTSVDDSGPDRRAGEQGLAGDPDTHAGLPDWRFVGPACEVCAVPVADPRLPATRRADALLELVARAVAAPMGVTRTPRAKVVVTMSHEALAGLVQGAGVAGDDEVLSAGTVRRLACEAGIVPMVLGGPSQVLDLGFTERYFTPAQRLALAARDGGCSYPGCTVPAQWCDAHHVVHWVNDGPTDLLNGALLCGRHHTRVHELGLTAEVTPWEVTWHRPPRPQTRPTAMSTSSVSASTASSARPAKTSTRTGTRPAPP
ncbi:DUF222 domain-containing protein [Monashia sp. NPDC004114]